MKPHINGLQLQATDNKIHLVPAVVDPTLIQRRIAELEKRTTEIRERLVQLAEQQANDADELAGLRGLLESVGEAGAVVETPAPMDAKAVAP